MRQIINVEKVLVENGDCTIVDLVNETNTQEKLQELTVNKRKTIDSEDIYAYDELF